MMCKQRKFAQDLQQAIGVAATHRSHENALMATVDAKAQARRNVMYEVFAEVKKEIQGELRIEHAEVF